MIQRRLEEKSWHEENWREEETLWPHEFHENNDWNPVYQAHSFSRIKPIIQPFKSANLSIAAIL